MRAVLDGFLGNLDHFYDNADPEAALWREFVERWWLEWRDTPRSATDLANTASVIDGLDLKLTYEEGGGLNHSSLTHMGMKLGKLRDRRLGDFRVLRERGPEKTTRWRLAWCGEGEPLEPGGQRLR